MQSFKQFLTEEKTDFAPWHSRDPEQTKDFILRHDLKSFGWKPENFENITPSNQTTIDRWFKDNKSISFNKNGSVTFRATDQKIFDSWGLEQDGGTVLGYKIQNAKHLNISMMNLISVWGAPDKCEELSIKSSKLETLEHLNCLCSRSFSIYTPSLRRFDCKVSTTYVYIAGIAMSSLSGIQKHFTISPGIFGTGGIGFHCTDSETSNRFSQKAIDVSEIITEGLLPILLIPGGLNGASTNFGFNKEGEKRPFVRAIKIIDKHLKDGKDILDCQEELIQEGLKDYAKL